MSKKRRKRRRSVKKNLFLGFRFRGRLKESPTGLDPAKFEPRIYALEECDHVRILPWYSEEDGLMKGSGN